MVSGEQQAGSGTHAIVGAGLCGLAASAALRRKGIPFEVFEASDDVGGNWHHGVYDSVRLISTVRTTEFPDYPMPADYPTFPRREDMLAYLRGYCDANELRPHIRFETRVMHAAPLGRGGPDDRWRVTTSDGQTRDFAGLIVANGHHWDQRLPHYPGRLGVPLVHAKDYRNAEMLEGRRVLVIGGGNSACDIAVEAARVGASAHISMRRGYWFTPRSLFGIPTVETLHPLLPVPVQRLLLRAALRVLVGDYRDYGLEHPDHRIFDRQPTINGSLLRELRAGSIEPHPDVARWDDGEVTFVDGVRERFDLVVAATGYYLSFPFLEEGVIAWEGDMPQLIAGMTPEYANLYIFGLGQARYGAGPIAGRGAEALATAIGVQRRLQRPLARVLWDLGMRPPKHFLIDPNQAMRMIDFGRHVLLPALPRLDRLVQRLPSAAPPLAASAR